MRDIEIRLNDIVKMKKIHPCGTNSWKIIRVGADIRIKCQGCEHSVLMPRNQFIKKVKAVVVEPQTVYSDNENQTESSISNNDTSNKSETNGRETSKIEFNAESELRKIGYRITGLNRDQRWRVLINYALPNLGLEQTVKTITSHIRNRTSQVNGATKFKYSITEWEYDLNRLKKQFYKNDFKWPSVK